MPLPPPLPDPAHIETRLLVVAQMLEKAVAEVRRAMAEIKGEIQEDTAAGPSPTASIHEPECTDE